MVTMATVNGAKYALDGLPLRLQGLVVKGFGRGSRELGIPTANFDEHVVEAIPSSLTCGVYFGWARVDGNDVTYPMVMSIGWNPYYQNTKKTAETHIIHKFPHDFYGQELRVLCVGFIRPERGFSSLQELIDEINHDIQVALEALKSAELSAYKTDSLFKGMGAAS